VRGWAGFATPLATFYYKRCGSPYKPIKVFKPWELGFGIGIWDLGFEILSLIACFGEMISTANKDISGIFRSSSSSLKPTLLG